MVDRLSYGRTLLLRLSYPTFSVLSMTTFFLQGGKVQTSNAACGVEA